MSIIFCNVGWMNHYDGIDGDSLERGGAHNKISIGHEVCNFSNIGGMVYGYVQPTGQIKIQKLGAKKGEDFAKDVTVVWTAGPSSGGTVVIGWYKNAIVYREQQTIHKPTKHQKKNGLSVYRISASASDAKLLTSDDRTLLIPRRVKGGIGQSNVWFADKPESVELVKKVLRLIELGKAPEPLPDVDATAFGLEGNSRLVTHLRRERDSGIIQKKKALVLVETGALCCEVCDFNFKKTYGDYAPNFCEVHHLTPLHKSDGVIKTELSDLAIVCSNCHRVLHLTSPMLSIDRLKNKLNL